MNKPASFWTRQRLSARETNTTSTVMLGALAEAIAKIREVKTRTLGRREVCWSWSVSERSILDFNAIERRSLVGAFFNQGIKSHQLCTVPVHTPSLIINQFLNQSFFQPTKQYAASDRGHFHHPSQPFS